MGTKLLMFIIGRGSGAPKAFRNRFRHKTVYLYRSTRLNSFDDHLDILHSALGCSPAGVVLGPEASPKRARATEGLCGVDLTRALN